MRFEEALRRAYGDAAWGAPGPVPGLGLWAVVALAVVLLWGHVGWEVEL